MQFLSFQAEGRTRLGIRSEKGVLDVAAASASTGLWAPDEIHAVMEGGAEALAALRNLEEASSGRDGLFLPEEGLQLAPCVPSPAKIICVGLNYRRHAQETGMAIPSSPVLFSKFSNALAASNEVVPIPAGATQIDYEAELAIVIGRRARNLPREAALEAVFGYCNANDLSARDLQFRTSQWLLGKTLDGFCPIGPYLVTADEIPDPNALAIRCWVNGELRQNSNTADMIFSCAEIVSYLSQYLTLEPGDIILTGTPEGVVVGYPEARRAENWLKPGDVVTVEVEGLGRLVNSFAHA